MLVPFWWWSIGLEADSPGSLFGAVVCMLHELIGSTFTLIELVQLLIYMMMMLTDGGCISAGHPFSNDGPATTYQRLQAAPSGWVSLGRCHAHRGSFLAL